MLAELLRENMLKTFFSEYALQSLLTWLAGLSLATFLVSLILIPFVVSKLAPDCFLCLGRPQVGKPQLTATGIFFLGLRNILGMLLLIAGIAMIFLPGQGILTIMLGILLLSFPGKQRLITYLISFQGVRKGLGWLRTKSGKQPFLWPEG